MLRHLRMVVWRRSRTTALVVALLLLAATGAGLYAYALRQWHAAEAAVKEGRIAEARSCLPLCLFLWPRSVPVHLLAARVARLGGDLPGAEAHLNQCLKLQNGATEAVQLEFLLLRVQAGEEDQVADALMGFVANKHPESPLILETLSGAYVHDLRYGPALACLERWIQEAPGSPRPYFWRGWIMERLNHPSGAKAEYQRALEADPEFVPARLRLAELFLKDSNTPEALPHLERLGRQHPDRPDVMARLGQCRF